MKKLLEIAKRKVDSAEVFYTSYNDNTINFENYSVTEIKSQSQSGFCLRVIKDGFLGTSYTKNLLDREELVANAVESLKVLNFSRSLQITRKPLPLISIPDGIS